MTYLKAALCWNGFMLAGQFLVLSFGTIGFHWSRMVDNDPFANSVSIAAIGETSIILLDGRTLTPDGGIDEEFRETLKASGGLLGIEPDSLDATRVSILVRQRRFVCGNGQPRYVIPIFRVDSPRYVAKTVAWGELK